MRVLAAAQIVPRDAQVEANVESHLHAIEVAVSEGVDVVVFPELSLTGYALRSAGQLAFTPSDRRLTPLRDALRAGATRAIVGAPVRIDAHLYLGAFVLGPGGELETYTKRHLGAFPESVREIAIGGAVPPPEPAVFAPGALDPAVPLERGGSAQGRIAICAEVGRPEHAAAAAAQGASVYLASMFVIPPDLATEHRNLRDRAARHGMAVVLANYGGPSGGLPAAGKSAIWSPDAAAIVELPPSGAHLAVARRTPAGWTGHALSLDASTSTPTGCCPPDGSTPSRP